MAALSGQERLPVLFRLGIEALAEIWTFDEIVAICPVPEGLVQGPDLAIRLRGAFKASLDHGPEPARRFAHGRSWGRASALLTEPFALHLGKEVPRPAVIRASIEPEGLVVRLRLFGAAAMHLHAAAEALARAIETGFAPAPGSRRRVALPVTRILVTRQTGAAPALPGAATVSMLLQTPFAVRNGSTFQTDPASIVPACIARVRQMAFWQRCELAFDEVALARAVNALRLDTSELFVSRFERHSRNQGDRPIPVTGHRGRLGLSGPGLAAALPWLALAQSCNAGSNAGLGLGAFALRSPR